MRDWIAGVLAVLVAGAVAAGAWWLIQGRQEDDPQVVAEAAVDDYLAAWREADLEAMAAVTSRPEALVAAHRQQLDALAPTSISVERGPVEVTGTALTTELTVALALPGADTWTYATTLSAEREAGTWTITWTPSTLHPELTDTLTFALERTEGDRAPILAEDGTQLTGPGDLHVIGIEPRRIADEQALLTAVAANLPEATDELDDLLARDDLRPTWFYPLATVRPDRFEAIWDVLRPVDGIVQQTRTERVGLEEGWALHVLGRATAATDEEAQARDIAPGTPIGRYGLEATLEDRLVGSGTDRVVLVEADGEPAAVLHEYSADPAPPVRTTLSVAAQQAAENALRTTDDTAAIVAVDATTGAIRASASRPLSGYNRAWEGAYPPGSTFKIVTLAALLADGAEPDDQVDCPGEAVVGGLRITNAGDLALGPTTLREAFAHSCNTTFAALGTGLPAGALAQAAGWFGFGVAPPELPLAATGGSFPEPQDTAERAAASFGQARVEASVLHMASVGAAAATGTWRAPWILDEEQPDTTRTLPSGVVEDLRSLLRAVVAAGSGRAADVGEDVLGKTGSAEFGQGEDLPTHAWFVGVRGDLAFAVLVEGGGSGSDVAAPLAGRFLRELAVLAEDEGA